MCVFLATDAQLVALLIDEEKKVFLSLPKNKNRRHLIFTTPDSHPTGLYVYILMVMTSPKRSNTRERRTEKKNAHMLDSISFHEKKKKEIFLTQLSRKNGRIFFFFYSILSRVITHSDGRTVRVRTRVAS